MSETRDQSQDGHMQPGVYPTQPDYPQEGNPESGNPLVPQPGLQPPGYKETSYKVSDYAPPDYNKLGLDEDVKKFDIAAQNERKAFLAKVYSILTCQLLSTRAVAALFLIYYPLNRWMNHSMGYLPFYNFSSSLFWIIIAVSIGCLIMMRLCGNLNRKAPKNFIFLVIFTLAEGFLLGVFSNILYTDEIITAVGIMAAVCLTLTVFVLQTKWSFNTFGAILLSTIVVLLIFNITVMIIGHRYDQMGLFFASFSALLLSIYLVYATQLTVDGKYKYSISHEEYVFAVLIYKLDIITVYPFIRAIIQACRNKEEDQINGQQVKVLDPIFEKVVEVQ